MGRTYDRIKIDLRRRDVRKRQNNAGFLVDENASKRRHLDSDRTRKEIFGVPETTHLPPDAYSPEATQKVVDEMDRRVRENLAAGKTVVVSATFLSPSTRERQKRLADDCGVPMVGIWLRADLSVLFDRVAKRVNDASDADIKIVEMQSKRPPGDIEWPTVDANLSPDQVLKKPGR